ncbi:hypothetical protein B296_00054259 [Ensete ventricosum]|uniref:Uncharacterized protein n=1 Tax=Ensete ventricosum TaxID=4639 RepID=A0A426XZP0_ENSVE|nr:hypothetical protein B296_00054259 [Ensete ventricosum]
MLACDVRFLVFDQAVNDSIVEGDHIGRMPNCGQRLRSVAACDNCNSTIVVYSSSNSTTVVAPLRLLTVATIAPHIVAASGGCDASNRRQLHKIEIVPPTMVAMGTTMISCKKGD